MSSPAVLVAAYVAALAAADGHALRGAASDPRGAESPDRAFAQELSKRMSHAPGMETSDGEGGGGTDGPVRSAATSPQPRWFTTDDPSYRDLLDNEYNHGQSAHGIASLFCHTQSLFLCTHGDYCPAGPDGTLFAPPVAAGVTAAGLAPIQWAPMYANAPTGAADASWVQVDHYGADEGTCYSYAGWTRGAGGDVEEAWGANHRKWLLCCATMSAQERWEMENLL